MLNGERAEILNILKKSVRFLSVATLKSDFALRPLPSLLLCSGVLEIHRRGLSTGASLADWLSFGATSFWVGQFNPLCENLVI